MLIGSAFLCPAIASAGGTLDSVRDEVYAPDRTERTTGSEAASRYDFDEYGRPRPNVWGALLSVLFSSSEPPTTPETVRFYRSSEEASAAAQTETELMDIAVQLAASGTAVDADLAQFSFSADLQILSVFELSLEHDVYTERLAGGQRDSLGFTSVGMGLQIGSPGRRIRLVPGLAMLRFADTPDSEIGAAATARLEVLPGPVVLSAEGEVGVVGQSAVRGVSFRVGMRLVDKVELFAGWGGRAFGSVALFGPRGGVRFWL
ncbi:MAG: hypothetical protein AAF654_03335 [Myxococcota bacterium]